MGVRIARGAKTRWRSSGDLAFRIETSADPAVVASSFDAIERSLLAIDQQEGNDPGPKFVSDPVPLPDGLVFWVDAPDASTTMVDRIIALVVAALDDAGIDARLSGGEALPAPPTGPWARLVAVPALPSADGGPAVGGLPPHHLDRAVEWVLSISPSAVWAGTGGATVHLPPDGAIELWRNWVGEGRQADLVADVGGDRRQARVKPTTSEFDDTLPHVALSTCGSLAVTDLDGTFDLLVAEGRTLAEGSSWTYAEVRRWYQDHPRGPSTPWQGEPGADEARSALADGVLEAHPWQLLTQPQVARLRDRLSEVVTLDPTSGELRLGPLDDWLRADASHDHHRSAALRQSMHSVLGDALITRDRAWEAARRRAGEELPPPPDLETLPIVGHASPHPSLGVTPLQLFSLVRGEPYSDEPDGLSESLTTWLRGIAERLSEEDRPRLREVAESLALSAATSPDHDRRHRRILADWLVRTLTPDLIEAAGQPGGESLRVLPPLTEPFLPLAPCQAGLTVLLDLVGRVTLRSPVTMDEPSPIDPVLSVTTWTERAACQFGWTTWQADSDVDTAVHHLCRAQRHAARVVDEALAHQLWSLGAVKVGTGAFLAAWSQAELARPRLATVWSSADRGADRDEWDRSRHAAGVALIQEPDADQSWDVAFTAAKQAAPEYWGVVLQNLEERLPDGTLEESWNAARTHTAQVHPEAHLAAGLAAAAVPAVAACSLASLSTAGDDRQRELAKVLWRDVGALVDRLPAADQP